MRTVSTQDRLVATNRGRIFVRRWNCGAGDQETPIVLFHDSLGCVDLWRDFPGRLCVATGRNVVAYDRLGFGRSDPHPGLLDSGFVRDEAQSGFASILEALANAWP